MLSASQGGEISQTMRMSA